MKKPFFYNWWLLSGLFIITAFMSLVAVNIPELLRRLTVFHANGDYRALRAGLQKYFSDNHIYPAQLASLTTPINYINALPVDPFARPRQIYSYYADASRSGWILWTPGLDHKFDLTQSNIGRLYDPNIKQPSPELMLYMWDPTNGTVSDGDIFYVQNDPRDFF